MGTQTGNGIREWISRCKRGRSAVGKSAARSEDVTRTEHKWGVQALAVKKKPLSFYMCPYRKPTQVDEKRDPKADGEVLLRNSAKMTP